MIEDLKLSDLKKIISLFSDTKLSDSQIGSYVIARTYSAGVFFGKLESRNGKEGILRDARRLWYWEGAASLSQLAMEGVSLPGSCKFPQAVDRVLLTEIIEILDTTEECKKSIESVEIWKA